MAERGSSDVPGRSLTPDEYTALFGEPPEVELELASEPTSTASPRRVDVRSRTGGNQGVHDVPAQRGLQFSPTVASPRGDLSARLGRGRRRPQAPDEGRRESRRPLWWAMVAGAIACVVLVGLLVVRAQDEEPTVIDTPEEVIFPAVVSDTNG